MNRIVPQDEPARIDLTPMLDVVFIMLIFFIVTATFLREQTIELDRPDPSPDSPPPETKGPVVVILKSDGQILFDARRVDHRALPSLIERAVAEGREALVVIDAEKGSTAGTLVQVADAARRAGIERVSVK